MSQEIQEAVYKQQEVIKDKQLSVKEDLDQVEPAVIEAQNGTVVYLVKAVLIVHFMCCHSTTSPALKMDCCMIFIPVELYK